MTTQQDFLRSAMDELNLTPEGFCHRLRCEQKTLDRWLRPCESHDFLAIGDAMWALLRDMLSHERRKIAK
jgi:hypothetical protein